MQTIKDVDAELKQGKIRKLILSELKRNPETFSKLKKNTKVANQTLTNHLKACLQEGLVKHKKRNAPYEITKKGKKWLELTETKNVEDEKYVIEYVTTHDPDPNHEPNPYEGSIIFHVPRRFAKVFNELYHPRHQESLRRVFLVAFEFWVNKCISPSITALGRDFNKDQIWDLAICEIPAGGYPNIKKAIKATKKYGYFAEVDGKKKGISHLSLIDLAFDALDEKLEKIMN